MLLAALQPVDGVGATATGYGIFALVVVALLVSVFIASLITIAFFAIRGSGRHHGSHP